MGKKTQKMLFSANSPRNILIFWETANFYVLLKEQSKPGKLHTLGVEFALGEVCDRQVVFVGWQLYKASSARQCLTWSKKHFLQGGFLNEYVFQSTELRGKY